MDSFVVAPSLWQGGCVLAVFVLCLALLYYMSVVRWRLPLLTNIPIASNDSVIFGWTTYYSTAFDMLRLMADLGPLVQGRTLNRNVLCIRDPVLAKQVLKDVKGKGFSTTPLLN